MTTITHVQSGRRLWFGLGLVAAAASILAVLIVQALALSIWPEIALFKPLDSYARSAVFTLVPVAGATALFAWLSDRQARPAPVFLKIAAVILLASIIPDYVIPDPNKTLLASTVTAFLHVVAAAVSMFVLVTGSRKQNNQR